MTLENVNPLQQLMNLEVPHSSIAGSKRCQAVDMTRSSKSCYAFLSGSSLRFTLLDLLISCTHKYRYLLGGCHPLLHLVLQIVGDSFSTVLIAITQSSFRSATAKTQLYQVLRDSSQDIVDKVAVGTRLGTRHVENSEG